MITSGLRDLVKRIKNVFALCAVIFLLSNCNQPSSTSTNEIAQCSATLPICVNQCCPEKPAQDTLVNHQIFVLANNPKTKFADWVAYKVDKNNIGSTRKRTWKGDPNLPVDETLSPSDYRGAWAAHDYDRGHQAPLASFTSTDKWKSTNYLSNITPQKADLNRGGWLKAESAVRTLAKKEGSVYVITGPLFEHPMPSLPNARLSHPHQVPSGYFKIVVLDKGDKPNIAVFVFDQNTPRRANICDNETTVTGLEKRLSFNPMPNLTVYDKTLSEEIGCA